MKVYRIERERHLKEALSGKGAQLSNRNRWNSLGTPLVYTSEHRSLAYLELAVHLDLTNGLPEDRYLLEIEIPDSLTFQYLNDEQLPENWNSKPPSKSTQRIGDQFVMEGTAAILIVPSAIVPEEYNFLLNPAHKDFKKIKVIHSEPLDFDGRLSARRRK